MNTNLKIKKLAATAVVILAMLPATAVTAGDDFGIWGSLKASKKLTEKLKFEIEGELRTIDGAKEIDRRSVGVSLSYDLLDWLEADLGYVYINSYNPEEKKLKGPSDIDPSFEDYNIDHAYREKRDRFFVSLNAGWKIGRVKFSLRERLQYQHTHSEMVYEDQYRILSGGGINDDGSINPAVLGKESNVELKDAKHTTTIRSRLTAKWDIKKCKLAPFASIELFTRVDEWTGHDKLRYRLGADYKIDKDNEISLYYMFQDNHSSKSPAGHAVCVGYSFDL